LQFGVNPINKHLLKKILLTGSNGLIGSHIYSQLEVQSSITSIDFDDGLSEKDCINLDLTDINQVNCFGEDCDHFDVLIFLVGLAHKKGKGQELEEFRRINKKTLINLLSTLDKKNKLPEKIIFASTISVYGEKKTQSMYSEDSSKEPFSPYAVTKLEAEKYLLNNYSSQSWILRFAPVYAPDFQLNINRRTKTAGSFYKVGNGMGKLSLCNLANIGLAIKGILEDKVPSGIYNISDEKDYSYNDLLKYVNAKLVIPIPRVIVKGLYYVGKVMNNIFLMENATKLISNNIFPSAKIRQYITLPATLDNINPKLKINN
jgi:nucleoside-diphosphate-sugar epimerase